ncbi:MAG TPA: DUF971 domain-containing protein [Terriglobia bacterium]|nr:DUF971 domain-containing protein [Terriglobia bacterium]
MAIVPKKVKLDAGGDTLAIEWQDGHVSVYGYESLRDSCPCATCTGAEGGTPRKQAKAISDALPMFKKAARPLRAEIAGRYALQIFWSDGHSSGIYGFSYLRDLCACDECRAAKMKKAGDLKS